MPTALNALFTVLFSLGLGQVAHLNVLATSAPTSTTDAAPALSSPRGICDITLTFFDGQSNQLATKEVWINPGSSASFSVPPIGGRVAFPSLLFYGEAQLMTDSDSSCQISASLDITGPGGDTTVLLPLQGSRPLAVAF
jgi:hypothetical protein